MLKNQVRRLVVLVRAFGEEPVQLQRAGYKEYATALFQQYMQLRNEHDKKAITEARKQARAAVRNLGLKRAAHPMPPIASVVTSDWTYIRKKTAKMKARCDSDPVHLHLGPRCRMRCGLPKLSWHSQALAEESRARTSSDSDVNVYECPDEPGNWHLGHKKKLQKSSLLPAPALQAFQERSLESQSRHPNW